MMAKPWADLIEVNIFEASDEALKCHVIDLLEFRKSQAPMVAMSVSECNMLLNLAHAELNARSASRNANFALMLATLSMIASAFSIFFR